MNRTTPQPSARERARRVLLPSSRRSTRQSVWLVTHSDTLIREAVSQPDFGVFHIHPAGTVQGSQASPVKAAEDLERVVIELVGELAAYRPGAKVAVFESTADAAADLGV